MAIVIMFICYVLLASSGLILFKLGSLNPNLAFNIFGFGINFSIKMILGLFCYGISFVLWMIIVSKINLTIAMPLSVAIVNTLVLIESCVFIGERISILQFIGIFVIILGVSLISIKK